jgi:hypothetical protein
MVLTLYLYSWVLGLREAWDIIWTSFGVTKAKSLRTPVLMGHSYITLLWEGHVTPIITYVGGEDKSRSHVIVFYEFIE